jgi:hypothetical protein
MKFVLENYEEYEKRLGKKVFKMLYKDRFPLVLEVINESGDEICVLTPFPVWGGGIKAIPTWQKRNRFIEL